ncbi:DNA-binding response regulator, OmpR family, contains REC and winged-helix (wHTH) domain [Seinonella peptonophila]|uniref:DNA-binding response regulator, OmpR family, contains REC and winged-helix (WHTH) domain n=1 Tax=Seinonella peptonophila TaxID=112248 RepID=A0A1M4YE33_9BACL|nr:response regulator transcription factor [Seinonella peptonophila]SHF03732.1 DNA-binding response regulator, OmpR family, contains REC and winged-helix (wHTH) domain [Seinonella peptonophila]
MDKRILIIDDDVELCRLLKKCLEVDGVQVDLAHTGIKGLLHLKNQMYHLIILDMMMPELDGIATLQRIRQTRNTPVLILTAKDDELDKVLGLKSGADDYLTKPFRLSELTARVESLIRRYVVLGAAVEQPSMLVFGRLKIDPIKMLASYDKKDCGLTSKEFSLLYFLASHVGQIFTKKQIYRHVWEDEYAYDDNNIMVHIRRLRKKIEPDPANPQYIITVWGIGYKFSGVSDDE